MDCLFCKIAEGAIPATLVFEDNELVAFRDLHQQAPTHILIIPKQHISTINDATDKEQLLLGKMILRAKEIARAEGHSDTGYRLVFNINPDGGQTVYHVHLHLLGGRTMTWPPG